MNNKNNETEAPGAKAQPSRDEIRAYLKKDFQSAYVLLDAIAKEDALLDMLTDYVYGSIVTRRNQDETPVK